jgi:integrase/recombinase XerD
MTISHFAPRSQHASIRVICRFSASPNQASFEDVRRYQLFLVESNANPRVRS